MVTDSIRLFTIGFTEKSAEQFFDLLLSHGVQKLIDTRVNNTSQLSGFAKGRDLDYFCRKIAGIEYEHRLDMAPSRELLKQYRTGKLEWREYTEQYLDLLQRRKLRSRVDMHELDGACLLCSEHLPGECHRSLLADYLGKDYPNLEVIHLT